MSPTALGDKLSREARGGDLRALAKIFNDYHQPLYRYCLAIVGNPQDAEDALQETMIKALRSLPGEKREIALRPWLYRVAHNESIELLRRRRENVSLEGSEPAPGGGLAEQVEVRERLRQLISDLGGLPERQRVVLLMREAAGLDFEEIGAALGTSPAVARQTLYEARLGLREMDAGREMNCSAITRALSDGDRRVRRRRDIRAHLRDCAGCRAFAAEIDSRRSDLAAISPLSAVVAAALLHGVLAGGGTGGAAGGAAVAGAGGSAAGAGGAGATGGGLAGAAAGTAAKSIGTATLLKSAAAVAVIAAIGVGAADRGGLIHLGNHDPAPAPPARQPHGSSAGSAGGAAADRTGPGPESAAAANAARARARRSLERARVAKPQPGEPPLSEGAALAPANPGNAESVEEPQAEAPGTSGVEQPSGRGHGKQIPPSAAHGEETVAANHASDEAKEAASGKGSAEHPAHPAHPEQPAHPEHPEHPPHPEHPSKPVAEAEPPAPSEAPSEAAAEHAANPPGKEK